MTDTDTVTIRVRGSITADIIPGMTARNVTAGDIIIMGQTAVRVSDASIVGNHNVRRITGHTGALAGAVSAPWEDYLPADTPVAVVA